jgi:hypothetical protein
MTATATATAAAAPAPRPRPRRPRRWHRFALPFLVLLAVWSAIIGVHAIEDPDLDDPGTLSPVGTGAHGSSRLADRLADDGIEVERVTSGREAIRAATTGGATVFVPAPDFLHPAFTQVVGDLPGEHRVVLVRPGLRTLLFSLLPVGQAGSRWAAATATPGCAEPAAQRAGTATVFLSRYALYEGPGATCYGGALVRSDTDDGETFVIGATEPFRNDRIDEVGNAALAAGLLSAHGRVIWVDVHAKETTTLPEAERPQFSLPEYRRGDRDRTNTGFPTIDAFPPMLWAGILLAIAVALLFALARGRRLGPPIPEPLPVLVPAAEVVTGRGRLYARVRAREATLTALRLAAIRTLAAEIDPLGGPARERELATPGPAIDAFVEQVAARTGRPAAQIHALLFGDPPDDDEALALAVADLDQIVDAVRRGTPPQPQGGTP